MGKKLISTKAQKVCHHRREVTWCCFSFAMKVCRCYLYFCINSLIFRCLKTLLFRTFVWSCKFSIYHAYFPKYGEFCLHYVYFSTILQPYPLQGRALKTVRVRRFQMPEFFKEVFKGKYEARLEFPVGWMEGSSDQKTLCGMDMEISQKKKTL